MSGLIESATAILCSSEKRLEINAHNVANISTPGFKRQISFAHLINSSTGSDHYDPSISVVRNFDQGSIKPTNNPFDLAISGPGLFQIRAPQGMIYSRQGQFRLSADGTLVTPQGYVLQQAGGGDLVVDHPDASVLDDGTVLDQGAPVGRLAVYAPADPSQLVAVGESFFASPEGAMHEVSGAVFRQGAVENSNVSLGDEMVAVTAAVRQSETGARLVQIYDDLIGRAITNFGQGGR
ncbi:flagellar hook-basal body protein [Sphingomonas sp.]|uniref:flagellar hook-basal body protein n=1 Tax=Sphingomonas sp. TaxID=28214 RepID=UPI0025FF6E48|nr:flagellar hook basal-body protein [Sphingomonas sp.]